jgi:DNA-binding beta-propeller fold protein YncE
VFAPPDPAYRWPQPPDAAHIQYLGELRTDQDLKGQRGAGQALGEALFGKEPARAMLSPLGVASDGKGRLFVADSNAQVLHVFDTASRRYARWTPPKGETPFSQPVCAAWDPGGRVLVSDPVAGVVFTFADSGKFLGTIGGGFVGRPCGVAVGPGGRVYISDTAQHQVVVLGPDGSLVRRIGSRGAGPGEFNYPTYLALDRAGRLYVSDSLNSRVQVFETAEGAAPGVRQVGRKGDMPGYFSQPKGITVDAEGRLYVVDAHFEAVQVFDPQGRVLMSFGREGQGPGEFWLPVGICADDSGMLWIADSYNRRVQVFRILPEEGTP